MPFCIDEINAIGTFSPDARLWRRKCGRRERFLHAILQAIPQAIPQAIGTRAG